VNAFHTAPEFHCDDLADLADYYAVKAPVVAPVPAGFVPAFVHLRAVQLTDYGFLQIVDTMLALFVVNDTVAPVYTATPDTARGARHMGYSEGVRKPAHKLTSADKAKAEARKWGLVA
jgi:hypothetical protein